MLDVMIHHDEYTKLQNPFSLASPRLLQPAKIMLHSYLLWSTLALSLVPHAVAFAPNHLSTNEQRQIPSNHDVARAAVANPQENGVENNNDDISRRSMLSMVAAIATIPLSASANDDESPASAPPQSPSNSIKKCPTTPGAGVCVSTSNVRQIDLYMPPWTFSLSPDEVMSRLKGSIVADPACEIVDQDGNIYLKAQAKRADLFGSIDVLEFVINASDQVVTFRSAADNDKNDLGANKRRLDEIRKRTGIFGLMGDNMDSADSKTSSEQGYGPLGQLKAFYGLQSGSGFEDVIRE
jgi:uncharacterized protein (DUF1499 family)